MGVTTRSQAKRPADEKDKLRLQNQPVTNAAPASTNNSAPSSSQPRIRRRSARQAKSTAESGDHTKPRRASSSTEPQMSEINDQRAVLYPKDSYNLGDIWDIVRGVDYSDVGRSLAGEPVHFIFFPSLDAERMARLQASSYTSSIYYYAEHPELLEAMPSMGVLELPVVDGDDNDDDDF